MRQYCAIHALTAVENRAESQTPAISEMMAITCDMNPLRNPCTNAGTIQIKRMISKMFIFLVKIVYLQFEKSGHPKPDTKIDKFRERLT